MGQFQSRITSHTKPAGILIGIKQLRRSERDPQMELDRAQRADWLEAVVSTRVGDADADAGTIGVISMEWYGYRAAVLVPCLLTSLAVAQSGTLTTEQFVPRLGDIMSTLQSRRMKLAH